jgi:hypothetical protein
MDGYDSEDSQSSIDYPDGDSMDVSDPMDYCPYEQARLAWLEKPTEEVHVIYIKPEPSTKEPRDNETCSVCLEPLLAKMEYCATGCGNKFHADCIRTVHRCPLCRTTSFKKKVIIKTNKV